MVNCTKRKDLTSPYLKDLKASNVKDSNEGCTLALGLIQCLVDPHNQPPEHTFISGFSQRFNGKVSLNRKKSKVRSYIIYPKKGTRYTVLASNGPAVGRYFLSIKLTEKSLTSDVIPKEKLMAQ